ncbi:MAG: hypothetical protein Q8K96_02600 [Rubrivivax sp.]|nr:hypothetical protein [Rubrivivax sp.]
MPLVDFTLMGLPVDRASIQAWAGEDANIDLRHVQPVATNCTSLRVQPSQLRSVFLHGEIKK